MERFAAQNQDGRFNPRDGVAFQRLFDGLESVEPGLVSIADWRAGGEPRPRPTAEEVMANGFVARVP